MINARQGKAVDVRELGWSGEGYRILPSWKTPRGKNSHGLFEAWIPALAPSIALRQRYEDGIITWGEFKRFYAVELRTPSSLNIIKPLGLLSLRRRLVLLCDCPDADRCSVSVLAQEIERCQKRRDFVLDVPERRGKSTEARVISIMGRPHEAGF
jgi:uncharacterized protein YeaO (DUF488 family)